MKRIADKNNRLPIFTKRFRELQGERTNTEFADFLGISRQTVGFYCNGDRIPDAVVLRQIAERCTVSADWLLGLSETKSTDTTIQQIRKFTGLSEDSISCLKRICSKNNEMLNTVLEGGLFSYFIDTLSNYYYAFIADWIANDVDEQVFNSVGEKNDEEISSLVHEKISAIIKSNKYEQRVNFFLNSNLFLDMMPANPERLDGDFSKAFGMLVDDGIYGLRNLFEYRLASTVREFIEIATDLARSRMMEEES